MKLEKWSRILWIKAIEENDSQGRILPFFIRKQFVAKEKAPEAFSQRADSLIKWIKETVVDVSPGHQVIGEKTLHPILFLVTTFGIGMLLNLMGHRGRIHLILNPFMGLWLWNLSLFAILICLRFVKSSGKRKGLPVSFLITWMTKFTRLPLGLRLRSQYLLEWSRTSPGLWSLLLSKLFHLGAISILMGAVLGLYLRGFLLNYTFSWESTFIKSPETLQYMMDLFLFPASRLSGIPVPSIAPQGIDMPGSLWIHLFAVTSLFLVVIPRVILLSFNRIQLTRSLRAENLPLSLPYFTSILESEHPVFFTYSLRLDERQKHQLVRELGFQGKVDWQEVKWGEALPKASPQSDSANLGSNTSFYVLFNTVQTPEQEIHGEICSHARKNAFNVIVWKGTPEPKLTEERLGLWKQLLRQNGIDKFILALQEDQFKVKEVSF